MILETTGTTAIICYGLASTTKGFYTLPNYNANCPTSIAEMILRSSVINSVSGFT